MPFTFSHPAAVLPFLGKKSKLSTSGLLIGSMVPDFEKFLRMDLKGDFSESLLGILIFDIPLSIVLLFVFHLLIRDKLLLALPQNLYCRFSTSFGFDWLWYCKKRWYLILFSITLGIFSHLLWDSFTHYDGFIALYFYDFFFYKLWGVSVFNVLQLISSIVGLFFVIKYVYTRGKVAQIYKPGTRKGYWPLVVLLSILGVLMRWYFGFERFEVLIVTVIASFMWALILVSILMKKPS